MICSWDPPVLPPDDHDHTYVLVCKALRRNSDTKALSRNGDAFFLRQGALPLFLPPRKLA